MLRRRFVRPLLVAGTVAALLLPGRWLWGQEEQPVFPDLAALGVPMDQLPQAEALLQAELDKLKAAGEPLTLAELAPPPVPDEENAALVYLEAFAALQVAPPETPALPPLLPPAPVTPGAGGAPPPDENAPAPPPPLPPPGAPPRAGPPPPPPGLPPGGPGLPAAANEEEYVAGNAEALALLEKAAGMPRCRWPQDWTKGQAMVFPYHAPTRQCARLLAAKMRVEARQGQADQALHTCGVSLAMSRAIKSDPLLIASLVSYALTVLPLDGLRSGLGLERLTADGPLPPVVPNPALPSTAACRALYEQLAHVDPASLQKAMLGERAMMLGTFDGLRRDTERAQARLRAEAKGAEWPAPYTLEQGLQVLALDMVAYLRISAETISTTNLAWREARVRLAALDAQVNALPPYCQTAKMLSPPTMFGRIIQKRDQCAAYLSRAQIALALVACHNETGQWPQSLEQLRKVLKWDLPLDPFSGKDFVYQRDGEGWVLYSVGPDLRDDDGAGFPGPRRKDGVITGDLVWRRK